VTSFQLPASTGNFLRLRAHAKDFCTREKVDGDVSCRLLVVLEELFTNTVQHGYRDAEGPVRIELKLTPGHISILYEDAAPPFDPLKAELADPSITVNKGKIGGMGLLLIRKMADSLTYERQGEWNRIAILMKNT
jgi:serine/threonine-protein kinase RsbW